MAGNGRRYTIGVLVSGILDEFTKYVCKGVLQEAKACDVNVVILPGKYLNRDLMGNLELMYEYQHNTAFSYAKKENIDALIVAAGSIGCFTSEKAMDEMLREYENIPCILLASRKPGYVNVVFDNYQGIREGLEYLINRKGCKKFAMLGGSTENIDGYERKQAFEEVLREHGIEITDQMYVEGDYSRRCKSAYRKLLDENPGVEAVFCVNDDTAMGFYEELKRRGLQAGRDIYVFGYDDTIVAARAKPSLSSVRADAAKMGEEAVRMAARMAAGEQVENRTIPTRFVKRDSFSRGWQDEESGFREIDEENTGFEDVFYWYLHEEMQEQMDRLRLSYEKMIRILMKGFDGKADYLEEFLSMISCVDEFLNVGGAEYADMDKLLIILDGVYRNLREKQTDDKGRYELQKLFSTIYKKLILAMNSQFADMKRNKENESYDMKLFVQNMLQFEKGRDQSYGSLLENLGWLNIKNAGIYVFSHPVLHLYGEKFKVPRELYLKAVLRDGEVSTVSADNQKQDISALFENSFLNTKQQYERVLLPLFFNEVVYGALLCDMDESLFTNGEFLINQLSSAIKMIMLLQTNEEIQQQLEENLATIKAHNIELNLISKSDMLTGILNRRGFYEEAQAMLEQSRREEKQVLVAYVDMNNLKIINDRYGHEEGDFSLKLIGNFLAEMVENCGVTGRIGGDEYAFIMEYNQEDDGEKIIQKLYQSFEQFNRGSDKAYNVTVSAGAYVFKADSGMKLEEALTYADEKLYAEKQHRKKEVAK